MDKNTQNYEFVKDLVPVNQFSARVQIGPNIVDYRSNDRETFLATLSRVVMAGGFVQATASL